MNHYDEPFQPETVDEYIEWLVKREQQAQSLPSVPGVTNLPSVTSARLVHDLRELEQRDARRLAHIKERLVAHAATSPAPTSLTTLQDAQEADHPLPTSHEQAARGARGIRSPFQESELVADLDTEEIPVLEPATLRSRVAEQKQRTGARHVSRWVRALAAVLLLGVLVGSFVTLLIVRKQGQQGTPTPLFVCQPYQLKQFDAQAPFNTTLSSVAAVSPNDAWAVGESVSAPGSQSAVDSTFIEHWDGKSWQVVPSPNSEVDGNGSLSAVAAVSANDVWAVGSSLQGTLAQGESPLAISRPLIEHWDGSSWQIMSNSGYGEQLNSLVAISQNDIWAVGSFAVGQTGHTFFEHWNGTDWQQRRWEQVSPDRSTSDVSLASVAAVSANDIWAVGVSRSVSGKQYTGLVMHWNGSQWQQEPTPPGSQNLFSVSAFSAQNIWVVGADQNAHPLVEHWDGQQWSNAALPGSLANARTSLRSIKAVSANDIWAVGSFYSNQALSPAQVLILHWNGNAWHQVSMPALLSPANPPGSEAHGIIVSGGQLWIVGDANSSGLILGQRTCP